MTTGRRLKIFGTMPSPTCAEVGDGGILDFGTELEQFAREMKCLEQPEIASLHHYEKY